MVPVPFESDVTRTPWTIQSLRRAKQVILACPSSSPGAPVSPPQTLQQYGRTFTLVDPRWHESQSLRFRGILREALASSLQARRGTLDLGVPALQALELVLPQEAASVKAVAEYQPQNAESVPRAGDEAGG